MKKHLNDNTFKYKNIITFLLQATDFLNFLILKIALTLQFYCDNGSKKYSPLPKP